MKMRSALLITAAITVLAAFAPGRSGAVTTLVSFNLTNGFAPLGSLIADANGDLFGTTAFGGANGDGTVFETGIFAGAPGTANCHGQSVSALARQFGGLNAAAAARGYSSVAALQTAIMAFCGG